MVAFNENDWKTLRRLVPYLAEYRWRVALALLLLVAAQLANVAAPLVFKEIVDALDKPHHIALLPVLLIIGYGVLRLANALCSELRDILFEKVTQQTIRRVALAVFNQLHLLSLDFHLRRHTGGIARDIERGTDGIAFLLKALVFNIFPTLVEFFLIGGILVVNYPLVFSAIILVTLVGYLLLTLLLNERRITLRRVLNEVDSDIGSHTIDSLLNYEAIKYCNNEAYESQRYDERLKKRAGLSIRSQTLLGVLNVGQNLIIGMGATLLLLLTGRDVMVGRMTLGDLVLINAFLMQIYLPVSSFGFAYREIKHVLADMEGMFALLDHVPAVIDRADAPDLVVTTGIIQFSHVDFGYEPNRQILFDVNFTVAPNAFVALVGASGSGKSTMARLLLRFYDVTGGVILIDGQDIRTVTQQSVRQAIAIVPQDTALFNDTLFFNIVYGRCGASRSEVLQAAQRAHIHDFILSLPEGYDTVVGERGLKLSGGEKQRVAIARALLKNPRILILDEATAALDFQSEKELQADLYSVTRHYSTLVIAHRLSTIVQADEILVLDQGRIVERGRHESLLAARGVYTRLWLAQQRDSSWVMNATVR